jgi:drug/metabolite transporter (DMT)-like permease
VIALWVPITLSAALFQTWRTALQARLRARFSVGTAAFVRFVYGVPVGLAMLALYAWATRATLPPLDAGFLLGCATGGLARIFGTALLIMAFGYRNFTVGTAYSKTDAVQAAIIAWIVLGETLPPLAWLGIGIGVCGVLVLSLAGRGLDPRTLLRATVQPAALCGISAGTGLAIAGVGVKAATLALATPDKILAALLALVVTNTMQTLMQGGWMAWRDPAGLRAAFTGWRSAAWVGAPVALVRTLGQVEVGFTLLFSRFYLRETLRSADIAGLLLVASGVLLVLIVH